MKQLLSSKGFGFLALTVLSLHLKYPFKVLEHWYMSLHQNFPCLAGIIQLLVLCLGKL